MIGAKIGAGREADVLRLFDVIPDRYRALVWLGAGAGLRISEALGFEHGPRCLDVDNEELHVVQQLRYSPRDYSGGFYLSEPKSRSSGTVDLDPMVADALQAHVKEGFGPVGVEMPDLTAGRPVQRAVPLMFMTVHGNPFTDRTWSAEWIKWRRKAGWPEANSGFHALRHFFATTLITNHADPKEVQRALRHATLQITLRPTSTSGRAGNGVAEWSGTCCGGPPGRSWDHGEVFPMCSR